MGCYVFEGEMLTGQRFQRFRNMKNNVLSKVGVYVCIKEGGKRRLKDYILYHQG